ncbi:MAG: DUF192 domain-containing protein [Pseudomonadota bacterium]
MGKRGFKSLILISSLCFGVAAAQSVACTPDVLSIRGDFGLAQFDVTIADDATERSRGLMFVEEMPQAAGMLFVYERPQSVSFWMRNTLIPLDMVFIGADGVIDNIHKQAQPFDETAIFGGDDIQFVLEINGGLSDLLGLSIGDEIQHPSIGSDAIWACPSD